MAYRLKPGKFKSRSMRAISGEQTARALAALSKDEVTPADVHEARKVVKRLRSLLKLVEPSLPKREFRARYRGIGRVGDCLAGARDRHVLEETARKLEAHAGAPAAKALSPLKARMQHTGHNGAPHLTSEVLAQARSAFSAEARKFAKLRVKGEGFEAIAGGLEGTYRTARKALGRAYGTPSDENFHELRKAVQWHWRHMSLLSRCWPDYFAVRIAACQEVAEALGDDHDLAVLLQEAQKLDPGEEGFGTIGLEKIVRSRQQQLRDAAYGLAVRLFADPPKAFSRRMKEYWEAKPLRTPGAAENPGTNAL